MQNKILILIGVLILGLIFYTMNNSENIKKDTSKVVEKSVTKSIVKNNEKNEVTNRTQIKKKEQVKTTVKKIEKQILKPVVTSEVSHVEEKPESMDDDLYMKNETDRVISTFNTKFPKLLEKMNKIPKCIENAQTKEEAFECTKNASEMHMNLAMELGIYKDDENTTKHDLVWNDEFKSIMTDDVNSELVKMYKLKKCVEGVSSLNGFDTCIDSY